VKNRENSAFEGGKPVGDTLYWYTSRQNVSFWNNGWTTERWF